MNDVMPVMKFVGTQVTYICTWRCFKILRPL